MYTCQLCKEEIKDDIAHINDEKIHHLSCYRKMMHKNDIDDNILYECPKCHTLGRIWNVSEESWKTCALCKGSGYLSIE